MNILNEFDTITAIATPLGTGGVGVIRISGDKAFEIIEKIFTNPNFEPRKFNHGWIVDNGVKIDETIVLPFFAPNSYTGENVVIPLDPTLTPSENAKKYFEKYNKLKRTHEALTELTRQVEKEIAQIRYHQKGSQSL